MGFLFKPEFNIKTFLLFFFATLLVAAVVLPSSGGLREKFRRAVNARNMTGIGMALANYAKDNDGFLPPGDMLQAMRTLRRLDYLSMDLIRRLDIRTSRLGEEIPLTLEMLPWVYFGEGRSLKEQGPRFPLFSDRPGSRKNFGQALFSDGRMESFAGSGWFEREIAPRLPKRGAELER